MRKIKSELTDAQWEKISKFLPKPKRRSRKGGRPPVDNRRVFEGLLWVLRGGGIEIISGEDCHWSDTLTLRIDGIRFTQVATICRMNHDGCVYKMIIHDAIT